MITFYEVLHELAGDAYVRAIDVLLDSQTSFSLVWRDQLKHSESAISLRKELNHLQLKHLRTDRWPGTRLSGHQASVIRYRCDESARPILLRPKALYSWRTPDCPEDLAFWDAQGNPVFASVAHEGDAWILSVPAARLLGQIVALEPFEPKTEHLDLYLGR